MAFCINTSPRVEVPPLHGFVYILLPFIVYFVYLLLLNELFIWVIFTFGHSSGDLFCTRALSWWPILYIGNIFVHYLFLSAILYIYFSMVSLSLLGRYFMTTCTSFFVTYSVHTHIPRRPIFYGVFHLFLLGVPMFTYFMVILWWPILYKYFYLGELFYTYRCFWSLILYSYFPMF